EVVLSDAVGDARADEPERDASFQALPGRIVLPFHDRALDVELDGKGIGPTLEIDKTIDSGVTTGDFAVRDGRAAPRALLDEVADHLDVRRLARAVIEPACVRVVLVDVDAGAEPLLELLLGHALEVATLAAENVGPPAQAGPREGEHLVAALHPAIEHHPDEAVLVWRPVRDFETNLDSVAGLRLDVGPRRYATVAQLPLVAGPAAGAAV